MKVNIIHRATRVAKADEKQAIQDAELAFYPSFAEALHVDATRRRANDEPAPTGVLIGRAALNVSADR